MPSKKTAKAEEAVGEAQTARDAEAKAGREAQAAREAESKAQAAKCPLRVT